MASLPQKSIKGTNFKKWVVDSIDKIIDYLSSPYLQNGNGISIRRTPSGTVIELAKTQSSAPQSSGGGSGGVTGIQASVSGGTAYVEPVGGTGSARFVGRGSVSITGNTSGEIEIDAEGIPMPSASPSYNIALNQSHVMAHDGWAVMTAEIGSVGNSGDPGYAFLRVINNGTSTDHLVCCNGFLTVEGIAAGSFSLPVVSGSTVTAYLDMDSNYSLTANVQANKILIYE